MNDRCRAFRGGNADSMPPEALFVGSILITTIGLIMHAVEIPISIPGYLETELNVGTTALLIALGLGVLAVHQIAQEQNEATA
jgi:hypothetical protein